MEVVFTRYNVNVSEKRATGAAQRQEMVDCDEGVGANLVKGFSVSSFLEDHRKLP